MSDVKQLNQIVLVDALHDCLAKQKRLELAHAELVSNLHDLERRLKVHGRVEEELVLDVLQHKNEYAWEGLLVQPNDDLRLVDLCLFFKLFRCMTHLQICLHLAEVL